MLLRSIHHVLHINRSLAVLSLDRVLWDASPWDNLSLPSLSLSLSFSYTHTHTHARTHIHTHTHIHSILNVCDAEFFSGLHVLSVLMSIQSLLLSILFLPLPLSFFLSLFLSLSLLSRCGWAGESCSSQTVHLPCSAKRPESSGRARAKGCSPRATASLHKPAGEERWL